MKRERRSLIGIAQPRRNGRLNLDRGLFTAKAIRRGRVHAIEQNEAVTGARITLGANRCRNGRNQTGTVRKSGQWNER